jgi:hypothetical protein
MDTIEEFKYLYFGIGVYVISLFILSHKMYEFWNTFWHEFSHIVFAVLTFSKVHKLMVGPDMPENGAAGYIQYSYPPNKILGFIRAHLVSLAPYFFSPMTMMLCGVYWLILPSDEGVIASLFQKDPTLNGLLFMIGVTYAYHLFTSFVQAKPYQSDFDSVGYIYGMFFVVFMQIFLCGMILTILGLSFDSLEVMYGFFENIVSDIDAIVDLLIEIKNEFF